MMSFSKEFEKGAEGKYLKFKNFPDGLVCQFISADYVENQFKKGEKIFQYTLIVEGEEKMLNSESKRLANAMQKAKIETNDWIKIVRTGEAFETKYTVEKVDAPSLEEQGTDTDINFNDEKS